MTGELIFVALSTFGERDPRPRERLESSGVPFRIHLTGKRITPSELLRDAFDATVVIAGVEPYDETTLAGLGRLRAIVRAGVGVDAIDLAAARVRSVAVLNTPDVPTAAVAELALAMFLALSRNLRPQANSMGARRWERLESHLIGGRTIGLIGFGRIGRRVAELARAFGARVIVADPYSDAATARQRSVELVPIEQLLRESDIVSVHAAKVGERPLRLGSVELGRMKRGALLVNVARGGMVDEDALVEALRTQHLAGAALDVFSKEPYEGPLCDFGNVILTPHNATSTVETRAAMELECVEKALRFLTGSIRGEERIA
jgi:D-3-phosphoglycerate dehydrogenase / 2-oxoglutarate reductase